MNIYILPLRWIGSITVLVRYIQYFIETVDGILVVCIADREWLALALTRNDCCKYTSEMLLQRVRKLCYGASRVAMERQSNT